MFDELLELVERRNQYGKEKPHLLCTVLKLSQLLRHHGVDNIRSAMEEELEDVNQKYDYVEKDLETEYKKKGLEVNVENM